MKWYELAPEIRLATALHGSIFKWEQIKEGNIVCLGQNNCPLCHLYWNTSQTSCQGCPVYEKTRQTGCQGTPLQMLDNMDDNTEWGEFNKHVSAILVDHIQDAEIEFLMSLPGKRSLSPEIRTNVEEWVLERSGITPKENY